MTQPSRALFAMLIALVVPAGCGGGDDNGSTRSTAAVNQVQLQPILPNLNFPVSLVQAPDGRVFFNERLTGNVRIVTPQWQLVGAPFCQIAVSASGEQGLLGLAVDPGFTQNHFVYVYYTVPGGTANRVVRYTEAGGLCAQETVILDLLPANTFHNGGVIQFGPDGKLYVMIGDSGNQTASQDLTSLAGKMLRINPDPGGSAPIDNPFFSSPDMNAKKVFSLGHRNSFGFTFHGGTGHLWQTENGPADSDEINRIVPGGNYGWPMVRGVAGDPNFIDPILTFTPPIAPTGIVAIPGNSSVYQAEFQNSLLFADFNEGKMRRIVLAGGSFDQLGSSDIVYQGGSGALLSLMLGADGFVYVSSATTIYRVEPL